MQPVAHEGPRKDDFEAERTFERTHVHCKISWAQEKQIVSPQFQFWSIH